MDSGGDVRAMVLAAGFGTRLGELTEEMPKPLLPLQGRPLIEYVISNLAKHGFDQIAVNLHFMPDKVCGFLGNGSRWNVRIEYSEEPELLGTAGGLKKMEHFLRPGDAFLVHYGDILTDQDLTAMVEFHRQRRALVTMLVHQREGSNSVVEMDPHQRVVGFWERPDDHARRALNSSWVNSAVCICDPFVFDLIPGGTICDLPRDIFPQLVSMGRLFGFPLTGYRCAIDSPQRYTEAQAAISEGRFRIELMHLDSDGVPVSTKYHYSE